MYKYTCIKHYTKTENTNNMTNGLHTCLVQQKQQSNNDAPPARTLAYSPELGNGARFAADGV